MEPRLVGVSPISDKPVCVGHAKFADDFAVLSVDSNGLEVMRRSKAHQGLLTVTGSRRACSELE